MIICDRSEVGSALALNTGAPGTYNLGDVIDTQGPTIGHAAGMNPTRDLGIGADTFLVIAMATAATSGGAATVQFQLVSDDNSALASPTVHMTTAAVPVASLVPGYRVAVMHLPSGSYERYVGVRQITGTAAFTGGAVSVFFTPDPSATRPYADNVN